MIERQSKNSFERRTSNIEHRTSNDEIASLRQFINWQNSLFKIRRWTFDVYPVILSDSFSKGQIVAMYLLYYNLTEKPFQINTDPKFLWQGEKHKEALAMLKYGILDNRGLRKTGR